MKHKTWSFCAIILIQIYGASCATQAEQENFLLGRVPHPARTSVAQHIIKRLTDTKLARKGPVLFPQNDAPPPETPLIVTARPLADQIRRSDPKARIPQPRNGYYQDYRDYPAVIPVQAIGTSDHHLTALQQQLEYGSANSSVLENHPYAQVAQRIKAITSNHRRPEYSHLEQQTIVPPLYSALDNYAKTKVLKDKKPEHSKSKVKPYKNKKYAKDAVEDEYYNDNYGNEAKHYAFSYSVRDHQSGDDFSHSQSNSGSGTNGEYRVKLPDGRVQIVSYTADNGGYNAEVRYEEDPDQPQRKTSFQHVTQAPTPAPRITRPPDHKLGRIIVPSKEYHDYQEEDEFVEYYEDEEEKSRAAPKEVVITSKPNYSVSTEPNLLYKQLVYHDRTPEYPGSTAGPVVIINGQEDGKYTHYYDKQSVQFISSTAKYEIDDNSIATGSPVPLTSPGGYLDGEKGYYTTSTPAPVVSDAYDHLDSPEVTSNPKGGQVKYTSVTPLIYRPTSTTPPPNYLEHSIETDGNEGVSDEGYYQTPVRRVDLQRYFTYTKR